MQTTNQLLMIRPVNFSFNAETAVNNAFQIAGKDVEVQEKAAMEFDGFVALLRNNGVSITVINDSADPYTPDSIFPNNWISFHNNGCIVLYPMFAVNRRKERKPAVLEELKSKFLIQQQVDFSNYEEQGMFMEGTGSMVLDRDKKIAYACISPRTHPTALASICEKLGYQAVPFDSVDDKGQAVYHTNVMMCVADKYVVVCLDSITNLDQRKNLIDTITASEKEIVVISWQQMNCFAGNMLQVHNDKSEKLLIMSSQAFESLTEDQLRKLNSYNKIVHAPLITIETNGGGSARCMMAEIFLKEKIS